MRLASAAGCANAYLRLWSKLSYVDFWYTAQQPATDERVASQNWHVDFDDKHLLKAFVYLTDVGPDHGPFEYVPGEPTRGRHHAAPRLDADGDGRVRTRTSKERPVEEIATFTGPKGTLILCNTSGLHRGGFATAGPRVSGDGDVLLARLAEGAVEPQLRAGARDGHRPRRPLRRLVGRRQRAPRTRLLSSSTRGAVGCHRAAVR